MSNSKTTESNLWNWLAKSRQIYKDRLHINRIENTVLRGMPDVEGCIDGRQFWIELKCASRPFDMEKCVKVKFQSNQIPWINRRTSVGGKIRILLQVGSRQHAARYLINGRYAQRLSEGMPEFTIANYSMLCEYPDKIIESLL